MISQTATRGHLRTDIVLLLNTEEEARSYWSYLEVTPEVENLTDSVVWSDCILLFFSLFSILLLRYYYNLQFQDEVLTIFGQVVCKINDVHFCDLCMFFLPHYALLVWCDSGAIYSPENTAIQFWEN